MRADWLVVGIAGATCSGKTTLAERLRDELTMNSLIVSQDKYFLPPNDPRHTLIPELNHLNWELPSSLDMDKMMSDLDEIMRSTTGNDDEKPSILIIDGFLLFSREEIADMCDLRYFLYMSEEECRERRKLRTYDPPDVPNYFDKIVWPEYVKARSAIMEDKKLADGIIFLDGRAGKDETFARVFGDIENRWKNSRAKKH